MTAADDRVDKTLLYELHEPVPGPGDAGRVCRHCSWLAAGADPSAAVPSAAVPAVEWPCPTAHLAGFGRRPANAAEPLDVCGVGE